MSKNWIFDNIKSSTNISSLTGSCSFGLNAGIYQGAYSVAIGADSGGNQDNHCIAVGNSAGQYSQKESSIAIGYAAGLQNCSTGSIAIGKYANSQGNARPNSVLIGSFAGYGASGQSVILNARGATGALNDNGNSGLYVTPLRQLPNTGVNSNGVLSYDPTTFEIYQTVANTDPSTATVTPAMSISTINSIIANTANSVINFQNGTYNITAPIQVLRNNVSLIGNQSSLRLANGANSPIIFLGDVANPPVLEYSGINIRDFIILGNQSMQTVETWPAHPAIYNNGIGMSKVRDCRVERCNMSDCISGGLTITYNSDNIVVSKCTAWANHFDGITAYTSTNLMFDSNHCYAQANGAGFSFDNNCQYMTMTNNTITNNDLGIFARWCTDITLVSNIISSNASHGMFLSGYNANPDNNDLRWTITGNTINFNSQQGLYLQSCTSFAISGNTICKNGGNGINLTSYGSTPSYGVSSYNTICGNTITGNYNVGFYNDASNNYTNGSRYNYLTNNVIKDNTNAQVVGDLTSWTLSDDTQVDTTQLILHNGSGHTAKLSASSAGNCTFVLPSSTGSNNDILQTNGSGTTAWVTLGTGNLGNIEYDRVSIPGTVRVDTVAAPTFTEIKFRQYPGATTGVDVRPPLTYTTAYEMFLPSTVGSANNLLTTDGSGNSSWTASPTLSNVNIGGRISMNMGSTGIYSYNATISNGGVMIDGSRGNIKFVGGTSSDVHTVVDSSNRTCFRVYNDGSTGSVGVNNGDINISTSLGSATLGSSRSGGSCLFRLPSNNGFSVPGSFGSILATDGAGQTSWTIWPVLAHVGLTDGLFTTTLSGGSSGNADFRFPSTNGTSGQLLQVDGAGATSWTTVSSNPVIDTIGSDLVMGAGVTYNYGLSPITIAGSGNSRIVLTFCLNFNATAAGYIQLRAYDTTTSQNVCQISYYAPLGISTCSCSGITDLATYAGGATYNFILVITPTANATLLNNSGKIQLYQVPA